MNTFNASDAEQLHVFFQLVDCLLREFFAVVEVCLSSAIPHKPLIKDVFADDLLRDDEGTQALAEEGLTSGNLQGKSLATLINDASLVRCNLGLHNYFGALEVEEDGAALEVSD